MYTAVKPLSKYLQFKSVHIYDGVFTLHSKCTVAFLLACTFLLSSKQYFGEPIQCVSDFSNMDFVHSYCWTLGTYIMNYEKPLLQLSGHIVEKNYRETINRSLEMNLLYIAENTTPLLNVPKERKYLRYYQWVVLVLLLESFVFYLPAFLWKTWEGGRLKHLCLDFHSNVGKQSEDQMSKLVHYFTSNYKETHFRYFSFYIFCEILNFIIGVVNMLLLNIFLDGFWSQYVEALKAIPSYNWNEWTRMTSRVFPKIAKCEVIRFGASGSPNVYDNLCLLPLNILNEKIFAFLWLWFMLMTLLAGLKLLYRVVILFHRGLRFQLVHAKARNMSKSELESALSNFSYGDWFVLMRVSNNISPEIFQKLLNQLNASRHGKLDKV
ncbi:innexin inx4 [Drosophila tropicalis]|uniref:innexin inx4 n=1 Tax=Drosophila tropicalis TaxID=46794 RepID=UPI0035ABCDBB